MPAPSLIDLQIDGRPVTLCGHVDPVFTPVLDAFVANFRDRRELGGSVCIHQDGVKVVDLWGGHMDEARERPWQERSLVSTASVIKGVMAIALHSLAAERRIDYDAPVARYWPEFAQNGKDAVTVRQLISHHAALHMTDHAQPGDMMRWDRMVAAIARQTPEWAPGTRGAYHTVTIIFILQKLIAAVTGEPAWDWFRRAFTERLGVEFHLRLSPAELPLFGPDFDTAHFIQEAEIPPEIGARFWRALPDAQTVFAPDEVAAFPTMTGGGNARGISRLFAYCAMGGGFDGVTLLTPEVIDAITREQWHEPCAVWGTPMRMGLGLLLNDPDFFDVGPNPRAFGTAGGGGSFGMADPDRRMSMGYALNRWWPALSLGERARALVDAAYSCGA